MPRLLARLTATGRRWKIPQRFAQPSSVPLRLSGEARLRWLMWYLLVRNIGEKRGTLYARTFHDLAGNPSHSQTSAPTWPLGIWGWWSRNRNDFTSQSS